MKHSKSLYIVNMGVLFIAIISCYFVTNDLPLIKFDFYPFISFGVADFLIFMFIIKSRYNLERHTLLQILILLTLNFVCGILIKNIMSKTGIVGNSMLRNFLSGDMYSTDVAWKYTILRNNLRIRPHIYHIDILICSIIYLYLNVVKYHFIYFFPFSKKRIFGI